MFCKNCGNQIAEGSAFCGVCGAKIAADNVAQPVAEQPKEVNPAAPASEAPVVPPTTSFEAPVTSSPAPKKFPKKLLFIGLPVIAVVLVVVLCFNTFSGLFIKTFASNSSYLAYVEGKSLGGYSNIATSIYGTGQSAMGDGMGVDGEIALELGESLTTMLSGYLKGMDLSWLKEIKVLVESDASSKGSSGNLALTLGGKTILTVEYIVDAENSKTYLRCKELNEKYFVVPVPDLSQSGSASAGASSALTNSAFDMFSDLAEYLPSDEELGKLLEKYIDVALEQVTDDAVEKLSGTVTAGGVTEDCTVLNVKITEKLVLNMAKAILTEAQNDGDIISILENIQKGAEEIIPGATEENVVEAYKSAITNALTELNNIIANIQGNGQEFFVLTDYVNSSHEIIGREISSQLMEGKISILSAQDGSDIGYEIAVVNVFSFAGKGTKSGDAVTGEYVLSVDGKEILSVGLEKFDASDIENKALSGSVILKLGKDAVGLMDSSTYSTIAMINPSIRMDMDLNATGGSYVVSVLTGENILAKLTVSGDKTSASVATAPADGDTLTLTEIDPSDFDFNTIIDNLKKAGVPESLLSILQYSMAG